MNNILCIAEIRNGALRQVSFELINVARKIAGALDGKIEAAVVGANVAKLADDFAKGGVSTLHLIDDPGLAQFAPEAYSSALAQIIREAKPSVVLWGATGHGKELSGRVAAKLDLGLATDCIDVRVENGELLLMRPIYAGKAIATVKAKTLPVMVSIRPNIFPPVVDDNAGAEIKQLQLVPVPVRAKVTEAAQKEEKGVDLAEAKVVISGGRGVKSADGFGPLRELAKTLNGALGASRAAVDSGWIDYTHQVGQTGKTVPARSLRPAHARGQMVRAKPARARSHQPCPRRQGLRPGLPYDRTPGRAVRCAERDALIVELDRSTSTRNFCHPSLAVHCPGLVFPVYQFGG